MRPAPPHAGDAPGLALRGPGSPSARAEPPPLRRDGVAPCPRAARNAVPRTLRARIGSDRGYPGRGPSGVPRTGAPGVLAPLACRGAVRRALGRRGARQRWLRVRGHIEAPAVGRRRGVPPRSGAHGRPSPRPARPRPAPRPAPLPPPARPGRRRARRPRRASIDRELPVLRDELRPDYVYDPRTRGWYAQALPTAAAVRTKPYVFFTTREVGTTVAQRSVDGRSVGGVDMTLHEVSRHLPRSRVARVAR